MEEIKLLVEAVAKLPNAALWVLLGYLVYKLAVVGSIYGTIRFAVEKLHSWKTQPKTLLYKWDETVVPINEQVKVNIINTLTRLKAFHEGKGSYNHGYVHSSYAQLLEKLVNEHISSTPSKN